MYTFIAENANGEQLQLTQNPNYELVITNGLLPPSATINTSQLVNTDGELFNSSKMNMRNLVFTIYPKHPVEANRLALYKIFKSKQYVKCYYKNDSRNVYIEGYVETIDGSLFDQIQAIQVSITCPQPYWKGLNEVTTDMSKITNMPEFTFSTDGEIYIYNGAGLLTFANADNPDRIYFEYLVDTAQHVQAMKLDAVNKFVARYTADLEAGVTYKFNFVSDTRLSVYIYSDELLGDRVAQGFNGMTFTPEATATYVIGIYVTGNAGITVDITNPALEVIDPAPVPLVVSEGIPFSEFNTYDIGTVYNQGEMPVEMVIDICFTESGTVVNPKVYNADTNEFFGLTGTFTAGEGYVYRIDCVKKTVTQIINGVVSANMLNYVTDNSVWLKAYHGQNMFYFTDDSGADDMYLKISFSEKYEGV